MVISIEDIKKLSLARKRLLDLSIKTIGVVPQLEEPDKQWVSRRIGVLLVVGRLIIND